MSFTVLDTAPIFEFGVTLDAAGVYTVPLSLNRFAIFYDLETATTQPGGEVNEVRARVGEINAAGEITLFNETVVYSNLDGEISNTINMIAIGMTSSTMAVFAEVTNQSVSSPNDRNGSLFFIPCALSGGGTAIVPGTPIIIEEAIPNITFTDGLLLLDAIKMSANSGAVAYWAYDDGASGDFDRPSITVRHFSMGGVISARSQVPSGGSPTGGPGSAFTGVGLAALTSTEVVLGWHRLYSGQPSDDQWFAALGTYTGSAIAFGTSQQVGATKSAIPRAAIHRQNDTHFALARDDEIISIVISGGVMTPGTPEPFDPAPSGSVGLYTTDRNIILPEDDLMLVFYGDGSGNIRCAHFTFVGTTITRHSTELFNRDYNIYDPDNFNGFPDAGTLNWTGHSVIATGGDKIILAMHAEKSFSGDPVYGSGFWDFGGVLSIETTLFDIIATDVFLIGLSVSGSTAYVTALADGSLILNVIDLALDTQVDSILLGTASLAQVLAKTYVAYPVALSDSQLYVFGRINTGITGIAHIMFSSDGGSNFDIIEADWGTDYVGSLAVFSENDFYAMRCSANSSALYHVNAQGQTYIKSTLPFAGPIEPHGLRYSPWDESFLAAVKADGEAQTVMYTYPPYLIWADITNNHPQTEVNAVVPL